MVALFAWVFLFILGYFNRIDMENKNYCSICGKYGKMRVPEIGISFGMSGQNYYFCYQCCKNLSVDKFLRILSKRLNYSYPLKLKKDGI